MKGTGPLKHARAFVHSRGLVAGARVSPIEGREEVELKQALDIHRGPGFYSEQGRGHWRAWGNSNDATDFP